MAAGIHSVFATSCTDSGSVSTSVSGRLAGVPPEALTNIIAAKVERIRTTAAEKGLDLDITHVDLPFVGVDEFDYPGIAARINEIQPDIVWVSLGAPKQEIFISRILPYVDRGVFVAIGAAFSFYTGDLHRTNKTIGGLRLRWLERIFKEPKKQLRRVWTILRALPKMYFEEKKRARK